MVRPCHIGGCVDGAPLCTGSTVAIRSALLPLAIASLQKASMWNFSEVPVAVPSLTAHYFRREVTNEWLNYREEK